MRIYLQVGDRTNSGSLNLAWHPYSVTYCGSTCVVSLLLEPSVCLRRGRERPRHVIPSGGPSAPGRRLSSRPQGQGRLFSGKGCCAKKKGAQQLLCCCRLDCGIAMYNIQHPIHGKKKRSKSIARRLHGLCRGAPRFKQRRGICAQGMERHEGYGHRCSSLQGSHNCMCSEFQGCGCTRCG